MTNLREAWQRASAHLRRAHERAGSPALTAFHESLDHNELELAADALADFGDEHGSLLRDFWEALAYAYENLELEHEAKRCRFRIHEAEHGFVEARLTVTATEDGGRASPVLTDYRPDWDLGNRSEAGEVELNGAPITLEDARSIAPGGSGLVRLHPRWLEAWTKIQPGDEIFMHEGRRVVGRAIVLRVTLRGHEGRR